MKRMTISWSMSATCAVASMMIAKNRLAPISTGRRPIRSAQHAQGERAHQHPEQARAEDWAEAGLVDAPRLDDGRRDVAHRLHIEAVDDDGQADTWKALTLLASITAEMSTA